MRARAIVPDYASCIIETARFLRRNGRVEFTTSNGTPSEVFPFPSG